MSLRTHPGELYVYLVHLFVSVFAARNRPFRVGYSVTKNQLPVGALAHPGLLVYPLELLAIFGDTSGGKLCCGRAAERPSLKSSNGFYFTPAADVFLENILKLGPR